MVPEKVPLALVMVRFWPPRLTCPLPDSDWMLIGDQAREISKMPLFTTPAELAMLPGPEIRS
jgi:hypothetical protein